MAQKYVFKCSWNKSNKKNKHLFDQKYSEM